MAEQQHGAEQRLPCRDGLHTDGVLQVFTVERGRYYSRTLARRRSSMLRQHSGVCAVVDSGALTSGWSCPQRRGVGTEETLTVKGVACDGYIRRVKALGTVSVGVLNVDNRRCSDGVSMHTDEDVLGTSWQRKVCLSYIQALGAPRCCGGWEHADRHRDSRHCVQVCTTVVVNSDTDAVCPVASSIVKKMFPSLRLILSNEITPLFLFIIPSFIIPPFPLTPCLLSAAGPSFFSNCSFN